jgi:hypothetical protein
MNIRNLTLTTLTMMWFAVGLSTSNALAQERLVFRVAAENTEYTQQHTIDVGDVPAHQVRLFEIKCTYATNAPPSPVSRKLRI